MSIYIYIYIICCFMSLSSRRCLIAVYVCMSMSMYLYQIDVVSQLGTQRTLWAALRHCWTKGNAVMMVVFFVIVN
jgi:hypothetical protein